MKDISEKHGLWRMVLATWVVGILLIVMILAWRLPETIGSISQFLSILEKYSSV